MRPLILLGSALLNFLPIPFMAGSTWAADNPVALRWLEGRPPETTVGVSWGTPWRRGRLHRADVGNLTIKSEGGSLPLQSWVLAYWPDGSIKWTGHALTASPQLAPSFQLELDPVTGAPERPLVRNDGGAFLVDTGALQARFAPPGASAFIDSIVISGREVARNGRLISQREQRDAPDVVRRIHAISKVEHVELEQNGPVRAVLKVSGRQMESGRAWLPFTLRLYFFAGADSIRIVHSFVYDGDQEKDFILGLGLSFDVPMREEPHNRHMRLGGEAGVGFLSEPVRLITGREPPDNLPLLERQLAGEKLPGIEELPSPEITRQMPLWSDYKVVQASADGFSLQKRTNAQSAWIPAAAGRRAMGAAFAGDATGGIGIAMRDFWQLFPAALEINDAAAATARVTAWFWSPDAPAMDLRHYDTEGHGLDATYEDYEAGHSSAHGVARTHELTVRAFAQVPRGEDLLALATSTAAPPRLVCPPDYYHSVHIFGEWSLIDRASPARRHLEEQLDRMFAFYRDQVEERRWYGFWDYGDVMHTYDHARRLWKYDVGGYAWMNSEELPDLWLWYTFLRSGRPDAFKLAEAMTRHTQEVDVYHLGKFAGLGSRHNVRHWGDGSKEARSSQALLKRFYYYLTTDERTGDLLREVLHHVEPAIVRVDPLRKILPKTEFPTHVRSGPDWLALAGNWLAEWERTGDTRWRDKIVVGMKSLAAMPGGLRETLSFGYDPQTGRLHDVADKQRAGQFIMIFGGAETAFELATLLDVPEWTHAWLDLCEHWARTGAGEMAGPRAAAFAARARDDRVLGELAWKRLGQPGDGTGWERFVAQPTLVGGPDVPVIGLEYPGDIATGHLAQWALNVIVGLELAGEWLPETIPEPAR